MTQPANRPAAVFTEHGDKADVGKSESERAWLELSRHWPQLIPPDPSIEAPEGTIMHASAANSDSVLIACPECHTLVRVPESRLSEHPSCARCKSSVADGKVVTLDAQSYETHTVRSGLPVLVDYWAPWCGPCRAMAPVLERFASERRTQLQVGKLNTDENPDIATRLGIRSIPTLILFREGREIARRSGSSDLGSLNRWVDDVIQHR
jgi:thioredoxin 2